MYQTVHNFHYFPSILSLELWKHNPKTRLSACLDSTNSASAFSSFVFFFFFCTRNWRQRLLFIYCAWTVTENFDFSIIFSTLVGSVYCLQIHKFHFTITFSSKMDLTVLFIYLKIIFLQYFQFLIFNFNKTNSIKIDPKQF